MYHQKLYAKQGLAKGKTKGPAVCAQAGIGLLGLMRDDQKTKKKRRHGPGDVTCKKQVLMHACVVPSSLSLFWFAHGPTKPSLMLGNRSPYSKHSQSPDSSSYSSLSNRHTNSDASHLPLPPARATMGGLYPDTASTSPHYGTAHDSVF